MSNRSFEREILPAAIQFSKEREYWMTKLSGDLVVSCFPHDYYKTDRNGDKAKGSKIEAAKTRFRLEGELFARLLKISKNSDARLFIILVMGLVLLLHKYTGHEDITLGASIDKQMIEGEFINTVLALRNCLNGNMTIKELLLQVRQTIVEACENQNYPLDTIPFELDMPVNENDGFPLFDLAILLRNIHEKSYISHLKLNLIFSFLRTDEYLEGEVEYNPLLYKKESIERIIGHFIHLMDKVFKNPDVRIADLEILTGEEKKHLLVEMNNTKAEYPEERTIHELFEMQVEKNPGNIAVEEADSGSFMSYRELNENANQLSALLREKGVNTGTIAAIMGERTIELVIGILAILKVGGVYLPIDAQNPGERIRFMLSDSGAHTFLSQEKIINQHPEVFQGFSPGNVIAVDDKEVYKGKTANPQVNSRSSDLAYIIYTSGTTGKPKGVMIQHNSLVNYINFAVRNYVKDEPVNFPLYSSIGFDLTVTSLFTPLVTGNTIVVYRGWGKGNLMARIIDDNKVHAVKVTPSHLYLIQDKKIRRTISPQEQSGQSVGLPSGKGNPGCRVKRFIVGGEILESQLAWDITNNFNGSVEIYNEYGPTEATVGCMLYKYNPRKDNGRAVPIGVPADNTQVYLLDRHQKPVAVGAVGELYVSGLGLAKGYLNRPELTAEKFRRTVISHSSLVISSSLKTNDSSSKPSTNDQCPMTNDCLYKTGDLARWGEKGNLEFLGRIDEQVKIRGFRIETGEIENQLLNHGDIKKAVVAIKETTDASVFGNKKGDKFLCAYIVTDKELTASNLREYLSVKLPDYMVPSFFVKLDTIPLTPNGKVDRKALPGPEINTGAQYTPPRDETEKKLVEIWSDLLGIGKENIGIDANFFELGGHSLSGTVLVANIHKIFNKKLPLVDIFRLPTIKQLGAQLKELERDLFVPIKSVEEKEYYPLSSAQERLFIIQQIYPGIIGYNVPIFYEIEGKLCREKLHNVFRELIRRHENFRTSFILIDGKPEQKIHKDVEFEIEYFDVSGVHHSLRHDAENQDIIKRFIRPFDLSRVPLLRVRLIRTNRSGDRCILMMDIHHIITDGVSMDIIIKEFEALYTGHLLSPLKFHYKDFSEWQNSKTIKEEMKNQETYWLKRFEEEIPVLELPTDFPRPQLQSFEGDRIHFELDDRHITGLKELAAAQDVTLFMVILSLYNIFLSKLSGQEDIIVGSPIAGRRHKDLEYIMGIFINTLALRNYPLGEKPFLEFLQEIKVNTLEAYENQEYQFGDLVAQVSVERDGSRNPLVDTIFALNNVDTGYLDIPKVEIPHLDITPYNSDFLISKVDILLEGLDNSRNVSFTWEYTSKLFKKETISRFIRYFKQVITSVLANSSQKISEIEILSQEEKKQVLFDFDDTLTGYPDRTIHELFEEQVERTPNHVAAVGPSILRKTIHESSLHELPQQISYKELNEKSNRAANFLKEKGVKPDTIVGIMLERSIEIIIIMMGILKSGGVYMPIEPDLPQGRIDFMLKDSDVRIVFNDTLLIETLQFTPTTQLARLNQSNLLAYVIYTSGTTGQPKGVMIEHRNVVRLMFSEKFQFDFSSSDIWTMFHSFCFDFSVWEIYGALLYGGKLILISKTMARDTQQYLRLLKEKQVTILNQTPAAFYNLSDVELQEPGRGLNIKYIIFAGEALKPGKLKKWREKYPETKLINMYGITETTVHSTFKEVKEKEIGLDISNIGRPIPTLCIYVMDRNLKLVPPRVAGELCVGGDGVARGYLNRPELTETRFVANPYEPGQILYRSRDLARISQDNELEYLGRIDHQVKIRGFRIELEEIENRLLSHKKIKEVKVLVKGDEIEDKYLCAFIVQVSTASSHHDIQDIPPLELREFLSKHLPEYMIPPFFVQLEKLPLTPNGKIDRKSLQAYDIKANPGVEYVAPETEMEKIIADIWREVLKLDKVGVHDNFFDIGGQSISIIKINTKLKEVCNKDISIAAMFRYPTINALVEYFSREENGILSTNTKERIGESVDIMNEATDLLFADEIE